MSHYVILGACMCLLLLAVASTTTTPTSKHHKKITIDDCPTYLTRNKYLKAYGTKCYVFFIQRPKLFWEASRYCGNLIGGYLPSIHSVGLGKFIQKQLYHTYGLRGRMAWIGLKYQPKYEDMWVDGTDIDYLNFRYNSSKSLDKCVSMSADDGKWLGNSCTEVALPYICQVRTYFRPPTSTAPNTTTTD